MRLTKVALPENYGFAFPEGPWIHTVLGPERAQGLHVWVLKGPRE